MPKTKKKDSSSDSDSGPDDRIKPASKKAKESDAPNSDPKDSGENGATSWTLEGLRQVRINEFRGRKSVDIREFYDKGGQILPGKKGISLSLIQWKKLLEVAEEVTRAIEN
uniref:RNA polymerase II transcriptional coactivator n=2 Tax=Drosophila melanogaster TaxID=7227 RepID=TCP4_DROME|eukprot:NP_477136.1 single stranded-binding protein c31A [Drosophila melanogaster]